LAGILLGGIWASKQPHYGAPTKSFVTQQKHSHN